AGNRLWWWPLTADGDRSGVHRLRIGIIFASLPSDRGCCPSSGGAGDTQDREPGKVACCCEELEVLVHPDLSAHARSPPAVAAAHAVGLLALHLGPGGLVVGLPAGIGLGLAGLLQKGFVGADADRPAALGGGAARPQRAARARLAEAGIPTPVVEWPQ